MHRWSSAAVVFVASAIVAGVAVQPRTAKAIYALNSPLGCVPELTNKVTYIGGTACSNGTATSLACPYADDEDLHQGLVATLTVAGVDNSSSGQVTAAACVAPQLFLGLIGHCGAFVNNGPSSTTGPFTISPSLSGQWGAGFGFQAAYVQVGLPSGTSSCIQSVSVTN
jgi:hypothetical protein